MNATKVTINFLDENNKILVSTYKQSVNNDINEWIINVDMPKLVDTVGAVFSEEFIKSIDRFITSSICKIQVVIEDERSK